MTRTTRALVSLVVGLGAPLVELALDCRVPSSEGCVWGRAYLPLSLGVGLVIFAPCVFGLLTLVGAVLRPPPPRR